MKLIKGMKPSEYLKQPGTRANLKSVLTTAILQAYSHPNVLFRIYLLENGKLEKVGTFNGNVPVDPRGTIYTLCEFSRDGNILLNYISTEYNTPKAVAEYLLNYSNADEIALWRAKSRADLDRLGVYMWFVDNTNATKLAKKSLELDATKAMANEDVIENIIKTVERKENE